MGFPKTPHVHKRLAELYAREANYRSAYEMLQRRPSLIRPLLRTSGCESLWPLGHCLATPMMRRSGSERRSRPGQSWIFSGEGYSRYTGPSSGGWERKAQKEWSCGTITLYYDAQAVPVRIDDGLPGPFASFVEDLDQET